MSSVYLSASTQEHNLGKDRVTEEARMQALASDVATILRKYGITVYLNKPEMDVTQVVRDSNAKKPDIHVALHSNALDGKVSGTETWIWPGGASEKLGAYIHDEVVTALGLPDRGYKDGSPKGKKKAEIADTKASSCLIELFFHDNASDIERFKARRSAVVIAVAAGILRYFGFTAALADLRKPTVPAKDYTALQAEIALLKQQVATLTSERNAAIAKGNSLMVAINQILSISTKSVHP